MYYYRHSLFVFVFVPYIIFIYTVLFTTHFLHLFQSFFTEPAYDEELKGLIFFVNK